MSSSRPRDRKDRSARRSASTPDEVGDDGLFVNFDHHMSTEERRRKRKEEEQKQKKTTSGIAGEETSSSRTSGTRSTAASSYLYSRRGEESSVSTSTSKSSTRRTPYSRELERRDRHRSLRDTPSRTASTSEYSSVSAPPVTKLRSTKSDHVALGERDRGRDNRRERKKSSRDRSPRRTRSLRTDRSQERNRSGSPTRASGSSHRTSQEDEERRRRREEKRARDREERKLREERRRARREEYRASDDEPGLDSLVGRRERDERRHHRRDDDGGEERSTRSHKSTSRSRRERERDRSRSEESDVPRSRYKYRGSSEEAGLRALNENEPMDTADRDNGRPSSRMEGRARYSRDRDREKIRADSDRPSARDRISSRSGDGDVGYTRTLERRQKTDAEFRVRSRRARSPAGRATPDPFSIAPRNKLVTDDDDSVEDKKDRVLGDSTGPSSSDSDDSDDSTPRQESCEGEEDVYDDDSDYDGDEEPWTVRVSVIKGVELPSNVVPNMPLCPILKFGLVKIPGEDAELFAQSENAVLSSRSSSTPPKPSLSLQLEKSGLVSIPKARVRCTSSRILSKKDKGEMEFHEEMRWDHVKQPDRTALAVELCARAAQLPLNYNESPLVKEAPVAEMPTPNFELPKSFERGWGAAAVTRNDTTDPQTEDKTDSEEKAPPPPPPSTPFSLISRTATKEPEKASENKESETQAPAPAGTMAGMRALFSMGRRQLEQRQANKRKTEEGGTPSDAASASAAVARFMGGTDNKPDAASGTSASDSGATPSRQLGIQEPRRDVFGSTLTMGKDKVGPGLSGGRLPPAYGKRPLQQPPQVEAENVALVKPKKRRKLEMAEDLRLGTLVVPLSKLPLAKANNRKEAVRIEQWYQLDNVSNSLVPTSTAGRRGVLSSTASRLAAHRNPSILLEISFSAPEVLDESEDELELDSDPEDAAALNNDSDTGSTMSKSLENRSFSRRASNEMRIAQKSNKGSSDSDKPAKEKKVDEDPVLEPGVVDFIAVVGASNIGDQSEDKGSKGWVNTSPECTILEQFPPNDEFHTSKGRNVTLQNKAEWFCFPEGCRLWRGAEPPSHFDLNLKRFSASSHPNVASSIAAFDACLNCTTSFSWFVIQSNEKENDFKNLKTYGAVIKFYAPAPQGIDSTQDDYAQTKLGGNNDLTETRKRNATTAKRLWVPMGILMTSNLPIVGFMEAMLLRLCESLASRVGGGGISSSSHRRVQQLIHQDLANLIVNFQKPIPGVVHCSIPFLSGDRFHLTMPPPKGLPPLPHGASVTSVCRLLGSEGLNVLLAAVLTESKILIHSDDIANLAMVAEVVTALVYPFVWSLPYLPVLPEAMIEFVEAPLSYFIGMPTCNLRMIDDSLLADVVVIDLDNGFTSPDYFDEKRTGRQTKTPTPMPATVSSNISKAVYDLLREEEEVAEEYGSNNFPGSRSLPRTDQESLPERKFRICVAVQISSLVRGYHECIFSMSGSHPVFNRDKFLRVAPALFEERRGNLPNTSGMTVQNQKTVSPRAKRFLSILTNCQHFYQFLETLDHDECAFFNEVMDIFGTNNDDRNLDDPNANVMAYGSTKLKEAINHLSKTLQKVEDKIPTYGVDRKGGKKRRGGGWDDDDDDDGLLEDLIDSHENEHDIGFSDDGNLISSFTNELLQHVIVDQKGDSADEKKLSTLESDQTNSLRVQYLAELEKGMHWHYKKLFDIPKDGESEGKQVFETREKVKLRDAIGDRRYRIFLAQQEKNVATDTASRMLTGDLASAEGNTALDLTSLLTQVTEETASETSSISTMPSLNTPLASSLSPEQQRVADAKDRDILRRCLQKAYDGGNQRRPARFGRRPSLGTTPQTTADSFFENGRDLVADAEAALRNPSAQKFLVTVLSQRSQLENQRRRRGTGPEKGRRGGGQGSISRLEPPAFECLVRLCCAMLDACLEAKNYASGYDLLTHTQGFCTVQSKDGKPLSRKDSDLDQTAQVVHMTARIALHPIFAELELWEYVLTQHLEEREDNNDNEAKSGPKDADSEAFETTKSTVYEMFGYGIPSEELARFASRISEKRGWFSSDRGHNLLMYARRVSAKRDNGDDGTGNAGDLDMIRSGRRRSQGSFASALPSSSSGAGSGADDEDGEWQVIGWCHPAAASQSRPSPRSHGGDHLLSMIGDNSANKNNDDAEKYLKRSAVTSLAAFGSSIVASGGLDGSVFVAHTIKTAEESGEEENLVRGVRLDWGSSGTRSTDGEYGVGAVSVLAAAKGAGYRHSNLHGSSLGGGTKDVVGRSDDDDALQGMEGCRVVAGTTGGDLRVWSVKDVYAATVYARKGELRASDEKRTTHGDDGPTSAHVKSQRRGITEIAVGTAFSRLKFSLRGRQLSGHKGGVSCADVPSHIYRPDALVTGGADGLIKLWSLRAPSGRRASGDLLSGTNTTLFNTNLVSNNSSDMRSTGRTGDAQSILTGHSGRVLCVKTAWHGDRLLSGGSDRTVRIWDLSGSSSSGKCLHSLSGHLGWVTETRYWGPNTIVSASTDRAIALWDARVRRSPIFVLRYHKSPISDLLVGSRTDPLMVSAGADGTVATWDFRALSGANANDTDTTQTPAETNEAEKTGEKEKIQCKAIRTPAATMTHCAESKRTKQSGPVLLSRGPGKHSRTVLSVGIDAVAKEWDIATGNMRRSEPTGHCDVVSCLHSFSDGTMGGAVGAGDGSSSSFGGIITSSWDGTIRMRKLIKR